MPEIEPERAWAVVSNGSIGQIYVFPAESSPEGIRELCRLNGVPCDDVIPVTVTPEGEAR